MQSDTEMFRTIDNNCYNYRMRHLTMTHEEIEREERKKKREINELWRKAGLPPMYDEDEC